MMERHENHQLTSAWLQCGLRRRDLLRLLGAGASLATINAILAACGGTAPVATSAPAATAPATTAASAPTTGAAATGAVSTTRAAVATTGAATTPVAAGMPTSAAPAAGTVATNVTLTMPIVTTLDITLDPQKAINALVLFNLYDFIYGGLVKYDKDARVIPDLAEKWDKSPDGLVYTFHLRDNAKFASGRKVTPDDFIYSWKRALDPKTPSPAEHFLEHIKGYKAFLKGETTELAGAKKLDDRTLEVTLSKPYNFFLSYACTYPFWAVDKELVEKYGDRNNVDWTNHEPYGTGAWKVAKFDPATGIELVRNEHYWGEHSPSVTKVSIPLIKGPTAANQALNLYKGDQAEILSNFPLSLLDAVEKDYKDQIVVVEGGGTSSVALSFSKKPFDNMLVRLAFAMAIDRERYGKQIWRGAWKPTEFFEPPSIPNYQGAPGIKFNLEEAKKVLAAAGFPNGQGLPPVTLYIASATSAEDVNRYRALADMWNKGLGANVQIDTSLTATQIIDKRKEEKGFQIELMGWINITETPQLMSEVFRTDSPYMKDRFDWGLPVEKKSYGGVEYDPAADAKKFDDLMNQADIEQDAKKRNDLYRQGEELMLKNAVYVPYGNYVYRSLVKPKVKGLEWGAFFFFYPRSIEKNVIVTK